MSGGSSGSVAQLDPALRDAYLQNVQSAQDVAGGLQARRFAGFNQDQITAAQTARTFSDPNSEAFTGLRSAFNVAGQVANYNPQNVAYNAYGGATVDPAALAAQQGYTAQTGTAANAGYAQNAAAQGYYADQFGGAQAAPASLAQATGYTAQGYGGQTAAPIERFGGVSAGPSATAVGQEIQGKQQLGNALQTPQAQPLQAPGTQQAPTGQKYAGLFPFDVLGQQIANRQG
jgi:hypothetical protein